MSLKLENVSYIYMKKTPYERKALDDVSLNIEKGEFVALIGHSGSGKSTLVRLLGGLIEPHLGNTFIDDMSIIEKNKDTLLAKRKVGLVFQYPEHQLFAETVYEDVAFGPRNIGLSEEEVSVRVKKALEFVHLPFDEFSERSPFRLSGGQMRRVAIAGIVAMDPEYLILDEPTAGLDPLARNEFYEEIRSLHQNTSAAIIIVTHSMEEANDLAERILVMSEGKIILDDTPKKIFTENKDILLKAGVDIPDIISLADTLREGNFNISYDCMDVNNLVKEIMQNVKEGK